MTQSTLDSSSHTTSTQRAWGWPVLLGVGLLMLLVGIGAGILWANQTSTPAADSADVGFAYDMSDHHRQAVEMALLVYDRSDDEIIKSLAYDILSTQENQIGIMSGWLDTWGYPPLSSGPRMAWMGMAMDGLMPGMATAEQLNELRNADGVEAEAIFMQLMIPHHVAGVDMANAAVEQADNAYVRDLAQGMANAQQFEIDYMQELLQERGYDPVSEELDMDMDGMHDMDGMDMEDEMEATDTEMDMDME